MSAFEQSYSFSFEAAHDLYETKKDVEEHRYKRLHGHSFHVEVTMRTEQLAPEGWVMDFEALKKGCKQVTDTLDHRFLNDIEEIGNPTLENLAVYIANMLNADMPLLYKVTLSRPSLAEKVVYYP